MRSSILLVIAMSLLTAGAAVGHAQEASLVKNGGFEEASPNNAAEAAGWCAWGGGNVIAQFRRVTEGAHSGKACMRLSPTRQYFINGRDDNWIRITPGRDYRVSFWVRSDVPHTMSFWIGQYKTVAPKFQFAGEVTRSDLAVGTQWREYSTRLPASSITAPLLYLAFQPVAMSEFEKLGGDAQAALYLDDVSFVAVAKGKSELVGTGPDVINGSTHIAASPEPYSEVELREVRPVNRRVLGIALHRVNGNEGVYSPVYLRDSGQPLPIVVENMKPLHLDSTRVYGVGVEPWPVDETLDRLKRFCDMVGIPTANVVVELENQNARSVLAPEAWGQAAAYSRAHKLGFRLWEIANEPYSEAWHNPSVFKSPANYARHVTACAKALHAADPAAKVGLEIDSKAPGWGEALMRLCAGSYDFACPHYYAGGHGFGPGTYYPSALLTCWQTFAWTRRDRAALRAANPGKSIPLEVTEWAGVGSTADGKGSDSNPFGTNIIGALHRAIRQVWYLREDLVAGAMQWQSHAPSADRPGFAFFFWKKNLNARTVVWYLSDLLNNRLGDEVLADQVGSPMIDIGFDRLPVVHSVCTRDSKTGRLCWVLVNAAREDALKCRLSIRGSHLTARGRVTTLTQPIDASPIITNPAQIESDGQVSFAGGAAQVTLPAHSISFVEVQTR